MTTTPKQIDRFDVKRVLGQGGMGVVYEAEERGTGKKVAIKTVLGERGRFLQAVRREIHALARLRHPGIVSIVAEGEHEGAPWYAMPFVEGVTLRRYRAVLSAATVMLAETEGPKGDDGRGALVDSFVAALRDSVAGPAIAPIAQATRAGDDPGDPAAHATSALGAALGGEAPSTSGQTLTGAGTAGDFRALAAAAMKAGAVNLGALARDAEVDDAEGEDDDILFSDDAPPRRGALGGEGAEGGGDLTRTSVGVTPDEFAGLRAAAPPSAAEVTGEGDSIDESDLAMLARDLELSDARRSGAGPFEDARVPTSGSAPATSARLGESTAAPSAPGSAASSSSAPGSAAASSAAFGPPGSSALSRGVDHRTGRVLKLRDGDAPAKRVAKPLSEKALERALELAERLCHALAYLHGEGLVHRDLKPDNVLVDQAGRPILLDFGLVTAASAHGGRDTVDELQILGAGTAPYIAPEQIRGEIVDARADLYALGCILYELIDGKPPFRGGVEQVYAQHLFNAHTPLREAHPWVPPALDELIAGLLQKKPADRFGSAAMVAQRLAAIRGAAAVAVDGPAPRPLLFRPEVAGRADELARLKRAVEESTGGKGGLAFIAGPSGFGKTRLAVEVARAAAGRGQLLVTGECVPRGARPLGPLRRLLQNVAERCIATGPRATTQLGAGARVLAAYEPSLSGIPGLDELPEPQPLPGREARQRVFDTLWSTMCSLAEGEGLVLLLDDLQWADDITLAFLADVAGRGARGDKVPFLVLSTLRDEEAAPEAHALLRDPRSLVVRVGPLDEPAVGQVIAGALGQKRPPRTLTPLVAGRASGNPFFVTEYVRAAVDAEALAPALALASPASASPDAGAALADAVSEAGDSAGAATGAPSAEPWREVPERFGALPASPRELLLARTRDLTADMRTVVEAVAVLGGEADVATVVAATGMRERQIFDLVDELRRRHIVDDARGVGAVAGGSLGLRIAHDKLGEFIYEGIAAKDKKSRHGRAARALEAVYAGRVDVVADALALHHAESGNREQAVDYLLRAGDQARALYATRDAVRRYEQAVTILRDLRDDDRAAKTLMKLGLVHTAAFDAAAARDAYERAFAIWRERGTGPGNGTDVGRLAPTRFVVAIGDPLSLDPARTYDTDSATLQAQLFEGLVHLDVDFNVLPAAAESWEVSPDGLRYRFRLRDDARWSDGRPVTAADFEFAWKRNLLPSTEAPAAQLLYVVAAAEALHNGEIDDADLVGVRAVSRLELDVTLRAPTAYFPYLLAHPVTFPQPWWLIQAEGRRWTHPHFFVGNGPYVLAERAERERLRLVKNEEYTGRFPGNAVDVECRIYKSYADSFAAYERGELDVLDLISAPLDVIRTARARCTREVNEFPLLSTNFVVLRADRPPFSDVRVRKAFALAVDRAKLAQTLAGGEHLVANGGFIPQGVPGHAPEVAPPFDPVRARELLAEAGFAASSLPPLVWLHSHGVGDRSVVDALAQTWREVLGVTIEVRTVRYEELERAMHEHPPDIVLGAWIADYPDPDSFLRATFHSTEGHEHTGWGSARYDVHVEQAARATRIDERIELYKLADRILVAEEVGVIPVSYGRNLVLIKPQIAYFPRSSSYLRALRDVLVAHGSA